MGSKTRLSSYCTKRGDNTVNLVTSRKTIARLARPIKVASALIRITEQMKQTMIRSNASNKYAHDLNLIKLSGVECGLRL